MRSDAPGIHTEDKFCIIGGGPLGIGMGKCFIQNNLPFDIIEKEKDFGGLWAIDYSSGRVYQSTHLISSKKNTQFSDFPMPDDYPNYPNHKLVLAYFRKLASHFNLYDHTLFNTTVIHVEAMDDKHWKVKLEGGKELVYRGIIIATGRLNEPIPLNYPGKFTGTFLHASQYKNPDIFKNKKVLIIGAGNSGCDIAVDAVHYATNVVHSMRRGYHYMPKYIYGKPTQDWLMEIGSRFNSYEELWKYVKSVFKMAGFDGEDFGLLKPDHEIYAAHPIMNSNILYYIGHGDIIVKPDIKLFKNNKVIFNDETEEEIDLIINASGYRAVFPFLPEEYQIKDQHDLEKLFMYSFHREYDNLLFIGYINTPSGLGNVANAAGQLFANYLKALLTESPAFKIFNQLKQHANPDLGQGRYMKTARHSLEVDLWKFLKTINFLNSKFK